MQTLGIQLNDVFSTLAAYLGSAYVNDFSVFGRTYRVMIQADAAYRSSVDDISRLEVRDQDGNMIPLSTLLTVRDSVGPQAVTRYNLFPSASITGSPRPGFSSGQAREAMEELAARLLPPTMGYEWTGILFPRWPLLVRHRHHRRRHRIRMEHPPGRPVGALRPGSYPQPH